MNKIKKIVLTIIIVFVVIWISAVAFGVYKYGGWSEYWNYINIETHRDIRYYEKIVQDGELTVYFKDHIDINHEISWRFENGKIIDYYASHIKFSLHKLWDARFINNLTLGRSSISFESPENKGQDLNGKDLMWKNKLELSFDAPEDSTESNFKCKGKVKVTYDIGSSSSSVSSYDATFQIINYSIDKEIPKRENVTVNPEDVINEMKDVLDEENSKKDTHKEEKLQDGKYCFQLDNLVNSGEFYYAEITIQNSAVIGNLIVEYEDGDGYSAKFIGTVENNLLKIKISYDNDGEGSYQEEWEINSNNLILKEPSITLTNIKCE